MLAHNIFMHTPQLSRDSEIAPTVTCIIHNSVDYIHNLTEYLLLAKVLLVEAMLKRTIASGNRTPTR